MRNLSWGWIIVEKCYLPLALSELSCRAENWVITCFGFHPSRLSTICMLMQAHWMLQIINDAIKIVSSWNTSSRTTGENFNKLDLFIALFIFNKWLDGNINLRSPASIVFDVQLIDKLASRSDDEFVMFTLTCTFWFNGSLQPHKPLFTSSLLHNLTFLVSSKKMLKRRVRHRTRQINKQWNHQLATHVCVCWWILSIRFLSSFTFIFSSSCPLIIVLIWNKVVEKLLV